MLNETHSEAGCASAVRRRFDSVLVLEDEGLLALMVEDLLREQGATNVRIFGDTAAALNFAAEGQIDCAILDVSLRGVSTYEVADVLARRNIPFLFCTGLSAGDLEERHRHRPVLNKPYGDADFKACLARALVP